MMQASAPATTTGPVDLTLPFAAESAHVARDHLVSWIDELSMDELSVTDEDREDARLVVSELIGNAVRHAQPLADGTVQVAWTAGPRGIDISVSDGGARTTPERVDASVSDVSGRGLSIVESLSTRWWVETSRTRTTVHALLALA